MNECVVAMKEQIKRIEFLKKRMEESFNSSLSISGISSAVYFYTNKSNNNNKLPTCTRQQNPNPLSLSLTSFSS